MTVDARMTLGESLCVQFGHLMAERGQAPDWPTILDWARRGRGPVDVSTMATPAGHREFMIGSQTVVVEAME